MFNAAEEGKTLRTTMKGGTGNGLEIMLDIQQDEYLPVWGDTGRPGNMLTMMFKNKFITDWFPFQYQVKNKATIVKQGDFKWRIHFVLRFFLHL